MMKRLLVALLFLAGPSLVGVGCKQQPFDPDGAYNARLAVYGTLRSGTDTQYVRVYGSTEAQAPRELTGLVVTLTGDGSIVGLRDTVVTWPDEAGTPTLYRVYVGYHLLPRTSVQYRLAVSGAGGPPANATVTALGQPSLYLANYPILANPVTSDQLSVQLSFGSARGGYIVRFYLEYTFQGTGGQVTNREEVPQYSVAVHGGDSTAVYPRLLRVPAAGANAAYASATVEFGADQYTAARAHISALHPGAKFRRAIFDLTQIDDALYDFYYVGNGPPDPTTIRLDIPDYTNITGGLGVFGSLATASAEYQLE